MKKDKIKYYAIYSHDSYEFVTDLYESISDLKLALEEGNTSYTEINDGLGACAVCEIQELDNYEVTNLISIKEKSDKATKL